MYGPDGCSVSLNVSGLSWPFQGSLLLLGAYGFLETKHPSKKKKKKKKKGTDHRQDDLVVEYELVPALILVLACELVEAQNLARARILPPDYRSYSSSWPTIAGSAVVRL
jgi:hypothetical protein